MEVIWIIIGIVIGLAISIVSFLLQSIGALRIDHSDEDGPYLFLELKKGVRDISNRKIVVLTVRREDFLPHK
nr:MAG TPA: Protein of unknown function (DUF1514) [Caudoviricetes sp.]